MVVIDGEIQRRVLVAIFGVGIGAAREQQLRYRQAVGASRNMQRLILILVQGINLRLVVEQDLGRLHVVGLGSFMQRRMAFEAVLVDVRGPFDFVLHLRCISRARGAVKRRVGAAAGYEN